MSKPKTDAFQGMKDLWGFHKEVHEDDWNDGSQLTIKLKNSSKSAVSIFHQYFNILCFYQFTNIFQDAYLRIFIFI